MGLSVLQRLWRCKPFDNKPARDARALVVGGSNDLPAGVTGSYEVCVQNTSRIMPMSFKVRKSLTR